MDNDEPLAALERLCRELSSTTRPIVEPSDVARIVNEDSLVAPSVDEILTVVVSSETVESRPSTS